MALERAAIDGDLVRGHEDVASVTTRERDALVKTEQVLIRRRLILDHDLNVRHHVAEMSRDRLERTLDELLEVTLLPETGATDRRRGRILVSRFVPPLAPTAAVAPHGSLVALSVLD